MVIAGWSFAFLRPEAAFVRANDKGFTEFAEPLDDNHKHVDQPEQEIADTQQEEVTTLCTRRMVLLIVRDNAMVICAEQNNELVTLSGVWVVLLDDTPIGVAARCTVGRIGSELVEAGLLTTLAVVGLG
jgi:hypothetical protein